MSRTLRVAIVGSREYQDLSLVEAFVLGLPTGTEVVSGGARGVDRTAERAALRRGLPVTVFQAQWELLGRGAGFQRNSEIVRYADIVVAFWDGNSNGTLDTIAKAKTAGKLYKVFR